MNDWSSWFVPALKAFVEDCGSQVAAAGKLGIPQTSISDYLKRRTEPKVGVIDKVMNALGGDLSRALPDWQGTSEPSIIIAGQVSAGAVVHAQEDPRILEGGLAANWRQSAFWPLVDASRPLVYLEVRGDSMEPDFPEGSLLACGRPAGPVPDLTPVIARVGDEATFKLLVRSRHRGRQEVELHPVNRTYRVARFAPSEVVVDYVVLGFANPWKQGVVVQGPKHFVMRENRP